jgi:bile acid:Na+ symporter, BASS family
MKLLVPSTVLLLMVSVGMSLNWTQFLANWRRLTLATWAKLLAATFIVPPIIALALASLLRLDRGALIGLFLIAVAPGAPLMTRVVAKRGFDMELAASYQLWGAFLTPIMIPLLIGAAGWVYGHNIWVSPAKVLAVIAKQQFVPLLIGVALMYFAPAFSTKIRSPLNVIGNAFADGDVDRPARENGAGANGGQSVGGHRCAAARSWLHCCEFCHPYPCNSDD